MKIKHNDLFIDPNKPFENCKLDRKQYSEILTTIVKKYADGFVLAINSEWGTGKTTFVKMWQHQLIKENFQTLYFNAWENDFEQNPLVALMAELKTLIKHKTRNQYKFLLEKGAIISKNILPQVIKAIADKYIDVKAITDAIENTTKSVTEILEDEIKEYCSKKDGIKEFKKSLSEFVQEIKGENPIVLIVDELDRCRPSYAVEVLEQIKHFFSVPGIVFILSIDKLQLGHAIRGVYGSDRINADEYLRRFIDLEYSIPKPETETFVRYLYDYFDFDSFIYSAERKGFQEFWDDRNELIKVSSILFFKSNLSLRQQEKLFAHARIGLGSFSSNQYIFPSLYIFLTYLKNFNNELYFRIRQKSLTVDELLTEFFDIVPKGITEDQNQYFIHLEALLAFMYHCYIIDSRSFISLINKSSESDVETILIKSKLDKSSGQYEFVRKLKALSNRWDERRISIEYLIKRIDLIQEVTL